MVKGGEEVRLDHRVQQLFDASNALLSAAADTTALHVPGVDVVPMTDRLGVLGFAANSEPLKDAIAAHATGQHDPEGGMQAVNASQREYITFLQQVVRQPPLSWGC